MPMEPLDRIDQRILVALQTDGRMSNVELAERVGLSPSPCLRRVKRLQRDGHIEAYRAVLVRGRVGLGFTAFVEVKLEEHANRKAIAFQNKVLSMPEVIGFHLLAGSADYLLEVVAPDLEHYRQFLVEKLLEMPIVREVKSNIAIQTIKAGAMLPLNHLRDAEG